MGSRLGSIPEFRSAQRTTAQLPIEEAWSRLAKTYEALGIPLTTVTPANHTLGNEGMRRTHTLAGERLSSFLDCGSGSGGGPNADMYEVNMSVVSQLQAVTGASTEVATLVQATATPLSFGSPAVSCTTTTALEQKIAATMIGSTAGTK